MRIGINTGEVLATLDARPEEGEGIVAGDVVNTAARIQAAAPANGVAVSAETYGITKEIFFYEELPPAAIKGKSEPLTLYRAIEPRARLGSDLSSRSSAWFCRYGPWIAPSATTLVDRGGWWGPARGASL